MMPKLDFLLEPAELEAIIDSPNLLIVDVGDTDMFEKERIPGAVHVDYLDIVSGQPPASGTLPPVKVLQETFSAIGLTRDHHVVAYDRDGNGRAARLLWTLDVLAHPGSSLLNGGFTAWSNEGHPIERTAPNRLRAAITRFTSMANHKLIKTIFCPKSGIPMCDFLMRVPRWNFTVLMFVHCAVATFQVHVMSTG